MEISQNIVLLLVRINQIVVSRFIVKLPCVRGLVLLFPRFSLLQF